MKALRTTRLSLPPLYPSPSHAPAHEAHPFPGPTQNRSSRLRTLLTVSPDYHDTRVFLSAATGPLLIPSPYHSKTSAPVRAPDLGPGS